MKAEVITIGDEILIGQIIDTNSAFIASELNSIGVLVRRILSIPDQEEDIRNTLDDSIEHAEIIILTGGLGPTSDDITKTTLANYFGSRLVIHEKSLENLTAFFKIRGLEVSDRNKKQAEVPDNCTVLINHQGTAPGMLFRKNHKIIVSLPGVPFEMQALMAEQVIPVIQNEFNLPFRLQKTILTIGIGESYLADRLRNWENDLDKEFKLAYLPSPGIVKLRLSISGENKAELNCKFKNKLSELISHIGEKNIFGFDNDTLGKIIGSGLILKNLTVSIAESCTGGYISHLITSVPGSSRYFKGSIIAYSNDIKTSMLNVPEKLIQKYGAVSREVVEAMAMGVKHKLNSDYSIATSGIAGPSGGTEDKPVGTTWIAVASSNGVISKSYLFGEDRGRNIVRASLTALNMLRNEFADQ